ncbi:MAG: transcriptional regulator, TetR family [Mycobacterium sp.]|nr:transcriptional regulator, TetR family [Mycobacterium sp.]
MAAQRHIQSHGGGGRHSDEAVLDAVRASVLAVGVRRTTLTDVSRRAGVSRMTLYRRWGDVDRLVRDLMTREFHALFAGLATAPHGRGEVVAAVVAAVSALRDEPVFARVLDVDPDLLWPYLTDRLGSTQRAAAALLATALRTGQDGGWIRGGDPDRLAYAVLLLVQSYAVSARTVTQYLDGTALDAELTHALDRYLAP